MIPLPDPHSLDFSDLYQPPDRADRCMHCLKPCDAKIGECERCHREIRGEERKDGDQ